LPHENCIFFALAELIAAWNCRLQSEKAMLAAGSVADGLAAVEPVEPAAAGELAVPDVLMAGVARLPEVQAAVASNARAATSTDNRVVRRVAGTP
jgi:hypothetical protein